LYQPGTSRRQLSVIIGGVVLLLVFLQYTTTTDATIWYNDANAPIQDNCDNKKWRICKEQSDCDTYNEFRTLTFAGIGTAVVPTWESEELYNNYKNYKCISPDEEIGQSFSWPSSSSCSSSPQSSSSDSNQFHHVQRNDAFLIHYKVHIHVMSMMIVLMDRFVMITNCVHRVVLEKD
jgi:hypothetical protein